MWKQQKFVVADPSHVGEIRRQAILVAQELEFDEVLTGKIAIVVTELGTNLYKHAIHGEILLSYSKTSCDIIAMDKGPGMANVMECLKDGYSTGSSQGTGLGAIERQAHHMEIFTQPGKGTVIYVNFRKENRDHPELCLGAINIPYKEELVSGDSWSVCRGEKGISLIVADGLGHGILAHQASNTAMEIFGEEFEKQPQHVMALLHTSLRSTRGAAISIAQYDKTKKILNYCGVGNVNGCIVTGNTVKRCISYNGTIGVQANKLMTLPYPVERDSVIILHSDGLSAHWNLSDYPGLLLKHPFVICGVLYRDFCRTTDDVTVVAFRGDQ